MRGCETWSRSTVSATETLSAKLIGLDPLVCEATFGRGLGGSEGPLGCVPADPLQMVQVFMAEARMASAPGKALGTRKQVLQQLSRRSRQATILNNVRQVDAEIFRRGSSHDSSESIKES
jgi:hypothetical protein